MYKRAKVILIQTAKLSNQSPKTQDWFENSSSPFRMTAWMFEPFKTLTQLDNMSVTKPSKNQFKIELIFLIRQSFSSVKGLTCECTLKLSKSA